MSAAATPPSPNFLAVRLTSPTLPLLLRTPTLADAPAILALLTNPLNTALDKSESTAPTTTTTTTGTAAVATPVQPGLSIIEARISTWLLAAADPSPSRLNLVVVDTRTSRVIGLSGFGHIASAPPSTLPPPLYTLTAPTTSSRSGNVGVMLNPEARGQGLGAEAIRLSVEWGFAECGFAEQSLGTLERNERMVRIVERVLVPRGWRGEKRWVEEWGEWEWEFRVSRERWEEGRVKEMGGIC